MLYAEIILPLPLPGTFTYGIPEALETQAQTGKRVLVNFGRRKNIIGIIAQIHPNKPTAFRVINITAILDEYSIIRPPQLEFWQWLSDYYMSTIGEIYQAAVPTGLKGDDYKPKTETYIQLATNYVQEDLLQKALDGLSRAPKQSELLGQYLEFSGYLSSKKGTAIPKAVLLSIEGSSVSALNALIDKGILASFQQEVSRLQTTDALMESAFTLNPHQATALAAIEQQFNEKEVILLHGVTSSGKTEIYIDLIKKTLSESRQVLYLVPEIALTTQLTTRLRRVFGNHLGVYHSKFSDAERVEIWNDILHNQSYEVILGVRSSIFLPFRDLGLIIVDEEHEPSFKQYDPAPRYHARNAAIVLAQMHHAKTLLGTATPSIESYFNAQIDKYGLVRLEQRFEDLQLPEIEVVDMREAYRKKQQEGHFSDVLLKEIKEALSQKEQVILFQNRRGYATFVTCKTCGYTPICEHCDVSLTYHAFSNTLRCHYCGHTDYLPKNCPKCHAESLQTKGLGTEKIEEQIQLLFPEARVARMDLDTTRRKDGYQNIITAMEKREIDILVGTQMITKGLDFDKVSLVGILNADNLLNFPDFRAHERAYHLLEQVSGRAGRKHKRGKVVIQTYQPEHPVIKQVLNHDYQAMFAQQIQERKLFKYPPYHRLVQITLKHHTLAVLENALAILLTQLQKQLGSRVLGPIIPAVARIQNQHIRHLLIKFENTASVQAARNLLLKEIQAIKSQKAYSNVNIQCDVDPY